MHEDDTILAMYSPYILYADTMWEAYCLISQYKRESDIFHESVSPWALGPLRIFTKIGRDIHNFVFISGVRLHWWLSLVSDLSIPPFHDMHRRLIYSR
jgi:hypothetical protein